MAQQPRRDGEGAAACTRVSVCLCVCARVTVRGAGGRWGRVPRAAGQRTRLCPLLPGRRHPVPGRSGPAESPHPLPGAAGQHQVAPRPPQPHAQVTVRPGQRRFAPSPVQNKSSRACAGALLGRRLAPARLAPSPHAKFLSSECLFYLPLCSGRRRAAPRRGRS